MKINQVEERVGITKRNIRYYEKEGLLAPQRDSSNGYWDYTEADVEELKKIKLLRKLNLPIEDIRQMRQGTRTLADALRAHIVTLEAERKNLSTVQALCADVLAAGECFATLNAPAHLVEMERMEEEGTRFVNIKKRDTLSRYLGPVIAAAVFIALMAGLIALLVWGVTVNPQEAPPLPLLVFLIAMPAVVILGVLLALVQRFKQIKGGEEDAASQY